MEAELAAAFEPVLRDLAGPDGVLPEIRDEPWADPKRTQSVMLYSADGSGAGVWIERGQPGHTQIAALADGVQEWAVEALWSLHRPTNWPPCPHHPERHPLAPVESGERAVWICPVDHTEIAEIGTLANRPS